MQGFADAETQTGNDRRPPLTAACDRSLLHSALKRCRQRQVSTAVKQIELDKQSNDMNLDLNNIDLQLTKFIVLSW